MATKPLEYNVFSLFGGFPPEQVIVARVTQGGREVARASGCFATHDEAHDWCRAVIRRRSAAKGAPCFAAVAAR